MKFRQKIKNQTEPEFFQVGDLHFDANEVWWLLLAVEPNRLFWLDIKENQVRENFRLDDRHIIAHETIYRHGKQIWPLCKKDSQ